MKLKNIVVWGMVIALSQYITLCIASSEPDFPSAGFTAYLESDNTGLIIRDQQNRCVARMRLDTPGLIDTSNVIESILYEEKYGVRWATKDRNKNAVADQVFEENFDSYELGENPAGTLSPVSFNCGGFELKGQGIMGSDIDRFLQIYFDSPFGVTYEGSYPYVPFYINQKALFSPTLDCADTYISFDLKTTGITADIPHVLSVVAFASSSHPDLGTDYGYLPWRLQNYPFHAAWYIDNPDYLRSLPSAPKGTVITININNLVYTETGSWKVADFSDVSMFQILFLQDTINGSGILNDWVARGAVSIDNFRVGPDNEPHSQTPLEVELTLDSVDSPSFKPGDTVSVKLKTAKTGNVVETVTDIQVFDPTFAWSNISASKIYDSASSGESAGSHIGLGETEYTNFTFTIPANAPEGDYRIFALVKDNEGTILDTTGPDISLDDKSSPAYLTAFQIESRIGNGPVALFDTSLTDPDNGDMVLTLDAGRSFHQSASKQIVLYEWDLDSDGTFDYQSINPVIDAVVPESMMPVLYAVMLRVTDDNVPAEQATDVRLVTVVRLGDVTLNASIIDNDSSAPAKWFVFAPDYTFLDKKIANAAGSASWQNVPVGDYIAEAYVYNDTIFPSIELAAIESVSVTAGSVSTYIAQHTAPYVESVEIRYADIDTVHNPATAGPVEPGRLLIFNITVRNDSDYDRTCAVTLALDRTKDRFIDITVNPTDDMIVPANDTQLFSVSVSPTEPDNETAGNIEEYWYAIKVDTASIAGRVKTDEYGWNKAFDLKPLPSRTVAGSLTFCGFEFHVVKFFRFAGVIPANVWIADNSDLMFRVLDYSGVGSELVTPRVDYHYGVYKAAMKVSPTKTELPEGTIMAFFHYWQSESETELQEIDVELRSMARNGEQSTSYADFTVHSKKVTDAGDHFVTFSCPVDNIEEEHIYEFRWKSDEIAFYIDGQLAYDKHGNPAVVNENSIDSEGLAFAGRIPDQPGRVILNHWAGDWNNTWAGSSPQGKGDYIAAVRAISFEPAAITDIGKNALSQTVLTLHPYDNVPTSSTTVSIYAIDSLADLPNWYLLDTGISVTTDYLYTDLTSGSVSSRFYKVKYE
ncbi:MAG: glycosyl hydrolase family protein [Candidatus Auribacter fodinae]|jgi:hypothetical protein|uniref:Glycosyl hydrolase family protein n=1 Tax=Candidatus Auribacter fodinae TaxID=2093366 RepID=A0A3A4QVM5_9BACT|nr:MAG: glycosyl hydrolase family protein [Candidatus Auribacter fodinae]